MFTETGINVLISSRHCCSFFFLLITEEERFCAVQVCAVITDSFVALESRKNP